jgi:hypothetical protein
MTTQVIAHWQVPDGSVWNIGQIRADQKKVLERMVRAGELKKLRSSWMGISPLKTVYVKTEASPVVSEQSHGALP